MIRQNILLEQIGLKLFCTQRSDPVPSLVLLHGGGLGWGKLVDKKTSMQRARKLRNNLTDAEQKLWYALRGKQIKDYKFRRQVVIESYIVDFLSHDLNLIIEVDGGQHAERENYDKERTDFLTRRGYKVLRFWNNEVLGDLDSVLEKIYGEIGEEPPP